MITQPRAHCFAAFCIHMELVSINVSRKNPEMPLEASRLKNQFRRSYIVLYVSNFDARIGRQVDLNRWNLSNVSKSETTAYRTKASSSTATGF